jgi:hypothetical protein
MKYNGLGAFIYCGDTKQLNLPEFNGNGYPRNSEFNTHGRSENYNLQHAIINVVPKVLALINIVLVWLKVID